MVGGEAETISAAAAEPDGEVHSLGLSRIGGRRSPS
jgi:hypothetical protein